MLFEALNFALQGAVEEETGEVHPEPMGGFMCSTGERGLFHGSYEELLQVHSFKTFPSVIFHSFGSLFTLSISFLGTFSSTYQ